MITSCMDKIYYTFVKINFLMEVSVIMPVYNAAPFLDRAIQSVLSSTRGCQTYRYR